jgi:thioredoxin 1
MTTATVIHITSDEDFQREVLESDRPVLVDFWAEWCQPCHMLSPTIEAIAEAYGDRITVAKVETDANPGLSERFDITSIPSVILFNGGKEIERLVGVRPRADYETALGSEL